MNPEITPELLAAAPVGSTIRTHDGRVSAVKLHDTATATPWRRVQGTGGFADDGDMATTFHARGDRLVWPADALPALPEGGFTIPEGQRERVAGELLSIVESIQRSRQTVRAYGVRISHPDTDTAADERVQAWERITQHAALQPAFDDGDVLLPAILRRLDHLAMLEGASTLAARMRAETPSAREWAEAHPQHRAETWGAMPLVELQRIGALLKREHDDAVQVTGRLRAAREHLADLLHTAADDVDPSAPAPVAPISQLGRYVP